MNFEELLKDLKNKRPNSRELVIDYIKENVDKKVKLSVKVLDQNMNRVSVKITNIKGYKYVHVFTNKENTKFMDDNMLIEVTIGKLLNMIKETSPKGIIFNDDNDLIIYKEELFDNKSKEKIEEEEEETMEEKIKVLIGTSNQNKLKEFKLVLDELKNVEVVSLKDLDIDIDLPETKNDFLDIAEEKADYLFSHNKEYICVCDDSGLAIDILDGFPGIRTKRFDDKPEDIKNEELIEMVNNKEKELGISNRTCHFVTAIAIKGYNIDKKIKYSLDGIISDTPRGTEGFGFDHIFEIDGKTMSEHGMDYKMKTSPRSKCIEFLLNTLKEIL